MSPENKLSNGTESIPRPRLCVVNEAFCIYGRNPSYRIILLSEKEYQFNMSIPVIYNDSYKGDERWFTASVKGGIWPLERGLNTSLLQIGAGYYGNESYAKNH